MQTTTKNKIAIGIIVVLLLLSTATYFKKKKKCDCDDEKNASGSSAFNDQDTNNTTTTQPIAEQTASAESMHVSEQVKENLQTVIDDKPIYFNITNTTDQTQRISLGNQQQPPATRDINTYSWDVSTILAEAIANSFDTLQIFYSPAAGQPFILYEATQSPFFQTVDEILNALNGFSIGSFTANGSIITVVADGTMQYNSLNILNLILIGHTAYPLYGSAGSFVYDEGYALDGTGTNTQISTAVPFWNNLSMNASDGPFNRMGIWNITIPGNFFASTFFQYEAAQDMLVYLGISGDNTASATLNNQPILTAIPGAPAFSQWNIYPIQFRKGTNTLVISGKTAFSGTQAGFAWEIYNNTAAEILASTSYADLTILGDSISYVGGYFS